MSGAFYKKPAPRAAAKAPEAPRPVRPRPRDDSPIVMDSPRRRSTSSGGASGWNVTLTPSTLLMLAVLLIITLCFFFLFGLIIGRGSVPPSAPAALERFIAPSSSPEGEGPEHILPEEDLRFMTNLRSGSATSPGSATPGAAQRPAAPATPTTPPASQTPAQQPAITQPPISQPTAPATPPATSTASDDAKFDFVLRVAAFKNEAPADALRLRLEEAGIRTRLIREKSQNTTWYHVQVLYRGTAQNFQTIRDSMPSFGLKDSILASKTPVP